MPAGATKRAHNPVLEVSGKLLLEFFGVKALGKGQSPHFLAPLLIEQDP